MESLRRVFSWVASTAAGVFVGGVEAQEEYVEAVFRQAVGEGELYALGFDRQQGDRERVEHGSAEEQKGKDQREEPQERTEQPRAEGFPLAAWLTAFFGVFSVRLFVVHGDGGLPVAARVV